MKKYLSFLIIFGLIISMIGSVAPAVRAEDQFGDFEFGYKFIQAQENNGQYDVPHDYQMSDYPGFQGVEQFFDVVFDEATATIEITPLITEEDLINMFGSKYYVWPGEPGGLGLYINLNHHMIGVDVLGEFIDLEERNDAIIGCESGGAVEEEGDTQSTNFFILFWRDIEETVVYTDEEGLDKSIRIIAHKDPAGERLFLGDFLVSKYFSLYLDDHCLEERELGNIINIEFDKINGVVSVTPLCSKQEFIAKASGDYGADIYAYFIFSSFIGDVLSDNLVQLNSNFTEVMGGKDSSFYTSVISIKLWTENDEELTYTNELTGETKTIRFVTHSFSDDTDLMNGDMEVDYAFAKWTSDRELVDENTLFDDAYSLIDYFDVEIDYANSTVTVVPRFTKNEFDSISAGSFGYCSDQLVVLRFVSDMGINLCEQVSEIRTRNTNFVLGPSGGGSDWFETRVGIALWTENREVLEYNTGDGERKSITIITYAFPAGTELLNDDFVVDHTYAKWSGSYGRVIDEDTLFDDEFELGNYFEVETDYDNSTITVTPRYTKGEFESISDNTYGSWYELLVAIRFVSFDDNDLSVQIKTLSQSNLNIVRGPSGGGPDWFETRMGISLWTENAETIEYDSNGTVKSITIITHAVPAETEKLNDDFVFGYAYAKWNNNYQGVDEDTYFDDSFSLGDYFEVNVDYANSSITVAPLFTKEVFESIAGNTYGYWNEQLVVLELDSFREIDLCAQIREIGTYNYYFALAPSGGGAGWFETAVGIRLWTENEEIIEYSVNGVSKSLTVITHAVPSDIQTFNNDFLLSIEYGVIHGDSFWNEQQFPDNGTELEESFNIVFDFSSGTVMVIPLYTQREFELKTQGQYGAELGVEVYFSTFKGISLYDYLDQITGSNFVKGQGGGGGGWDITGIGIRLWTDNDAILLYEDTKTGETKSIHFITYAEPRYAINETVLDTIIDTGSVVSNDEEMAARIIMSVTDSDSLGIDVRSIQTAVKDGINLAELLPDQLTGDEIENLTRVDYQTALEIKLLEVYVDARTIRFALSITPLYSVKGSFVDGTQKELDNGTVEVSGPVDIAFFVGDCLGYDEKVKVHHIKASGAEYEYDGRIDSEGYLRFTDTEGFSVFEIVSPAPGHSHDLIHLEENAADCENGGNIECWKCGICGRYYTDANGYNEINEQDVLTTALGHDWDDGTITAEPTCVSAGEKAFRCTRCDSERTETISALGHDYEDTVTEPTCESAGYTTHTCRRCAHSFSDSSVEAFGHDWDDGEITTEPTCIEIGIKTYTCTRCGETYTETIPMTEHHYEETVTAATCIQGGYTTHTCTMCGDCYQDSFTEALGHDYLTETVEPTCTQRGYTVYTCSRCGDSYTANYTEASGHAWNDGEITTEPTCTENGIRTYTCTRCGETFKETIQSEGHSYHTAITQPTCTDAGYTTYICSRCGDSYKSDYTDPLGHTWDGGTVTSEPTCTSKGTRLHICIICGEKDTEEIPALGHDYEDTVTEPTCEEDGYTTHNCTRCGHSYTDAHVSALGHDYILTCWDWAADFSKATAAFECRRDPNHTVYVTGVAETRTETAADGTVTAYHEVTVLFEEETYSNTQTETISVPKTGWQYENGEWYFYKSDGTLLTNGWAKDSTGWMWMGSDGKITKSKWIKDNGEWYYLKSNGYMAANEWTKDSSGWMYMDNSGKITKNKWIKDNGDWYYLKSNGYMAANEWTKDSSGWMNMDGSGKIVKNKWIKDNGEWYYMKSNGYMAANEWAKDSGGWMYMDGSGKITKSKWIQYKGDWYYLKADGYMATGTLTISGKEYTFASSGKLAA